MGPFRYNTLAVADCSRSQFCGRAAPKKDCEPLGLPLSGHPLFAVFQFCFSGRPFFAKGSCTHLHGSHFFLASRPSFRLFGWGEGTSDTEDFSLHAPRRDKLTLYVPFMRQTAGLYPHSTPFATFGLALAAESSGARAAGHRQQRGGPAGLAPAARCGAGGPGGTKVFSVGALFLVGGVVCSFSVGALLSWLWLFTCSLIATTETSILGVTP